MQELPYALYRVAKGLLEAFEGEMAIEQDAFCEMDVSRDGINVTCELLGAKAGDIRINATDRGIYVRVMKGRIAAFSHFFEVCGIRRKDLDINFINGVLSIYAPFQKDLY